MLKCVSHKYLEFQCFCNDPEETSEMFWRTSPKRRTLMTDDEIRSKIRRIVVCYSELELSDIGDDDDLTQIVDWSAFPSDQQVGHIIDVFIQEFNIIVPGQEYSEWAAEKRIPALLRPLFYIPYLLWIREPFVIDKLSVNDMVCIAKKGIWHAF